MQAQQREDNLQLASMLGGRTAGALLRTPLSVLVLLVLCRDLFRFSLFLLLPVCCSFHLLSFLFVVLFHRFMFAADVDRYRAETETELGVSE